MHGAEVPGPGSGLLAAALRAGRRHPVGGERGHVPRDAGPPGALRSDAGGAMLCL